MSFMLTALRSATLFSMLLATAPAGLAIEQPSLAPMLSRVLPGVVSVAVQGQAHDETDPLLTDPFFRRFFGLPNQPPPTQRSFQAAGSGVIVDAVKGYILTNDHVVENADRINVTVASGASYQAKIIGTDTDTDVAVIKIDAPNLTAVPLGDSSKLQVGDYVAAIGNPFGLSQTATLGIVSALGRGDLGIEGYENFIQTDASINPGNSGGALVNLDGELIGINSAIIGPSGGNVGIGFAIPINMAKTVMEQLIAHGKIIRGQLGVIVQNLTPGLARTLKIDAPSAAIVSDVIPGSAAEGAGIIAGDAILSINGAVIRDASDLRNVIGQLPPNATVQLIVERAGRRIEINVGLTVAQKSPIEQPGRVFHIQTGLLADVDLQEIPSDSTAFGKVKGVFVMSVDDASLAAQAGLQAGDIITAINQRPVNTFRDALAAADRGAKEVLLTVYRDGWNRFLTIEGQ